MMMMMTTKMKCESLMAYEKYTDESVNVNDVNHGYK
jgi:hypothetical protein